MIRVLIADDHGIVRSGLRMLIDRQADMHVVAEATDGVGALESAQAEHPDVAVLDVSMPRMTGLQAAREIRAHAPATRVLLLSMHDDDHYFLQGLEAGASGYVLKRAADTDLIEALRTVAGGRTFHSSEAQRALRSEWLDGSRDGPQDPLTPRELEVVKLIAEAFTNRQIAETLRVSEKTVESHRANLLAKLGMRDRVELARYAIRRGLVEPWQRAVTLGPVNPRILVALVLVAVFALMATVLAAGDAGDNEGPVSGGSRFAGAVMPRGVRAPDFTLRDQDGDEISMRELRGRPVVVTFLYTHCEDTCPLQAQTVRGALDLLGHDVPALAVAVDPPNDTQASARAFLSKQRVIGRMRFVLGSRAQLEPLWNGFHIRPQRVTEEHQARFTLVDKRGYQRVGYPGFAATPEGLAHDIALLEEEAG